MQPNPLTEVSAPEQEEYGELGGSSNGNGTQESFAEAGSIGQEAHQLIELGLESIAQLNDDTPLENNLGSTDLQDVSSENDETATLTDEAMAKLPEAYKASYPEAATLNVEANQDSDNPPASEVIIGTDDRIRIHGTSSYPWRAVCSLLIKTRTGRYYIGTGWFIGPRTVMTAGHCVYLHNEGGWAESVTVMPGRNGSYKPYGSTRATHLRSNTGWTNNRNPDNDYGCIILPSNKRVGARTGWFGFAYMGDSALKKKYLNLPGYPGDKPAGTMWYHHRRVKKTTSRRVFYDIDTMGGQSGSPVYYITNGKRYAVGIHAYGHQSGNSAPRITKGVFNLMKHWKQLGQ